MTENNVLDPFKELAGAVASGDNLKIYYAQRRVIVKKISDPDLDPREFSALSGQLLNASKAIVALEGAKEELSAAEEAAIEKLIAAQDAVDNPGNYFK